MNRLTRIAILVVLLLLLFPNTNGKLDAKSKFEIGGAFVGVFDYLDQSGAPADSPKRRQLDFTGNIDLLWHVSKEIRVVMQFQGGPGEGSLGFAGSSVAVTDLNVEIDLSSSFTLIIGSYDTPFGADTPFLTNNGDTSQNPLILNTLFYSAFAGTNVGTLNTLGIKGELKSKYGNFTAAVTNGTDEAAFNPEGNFEIVVFAQTPVFLKGFTLGASYLHSDDRSESGESGTGSKFRAWMLDGGLQLGKVFCGKGYYGQLTYGDEDAGTDDHVRIWKAEARYNIKPEKFYIAGRVSGWEPDRSGIVVNSLVPNPGFSRGEFSGNNWFYAAHDIRRYQVGFGWYIKPSVLVKAEWFYDDYRSGSNGNPDTRGVIVVCNVLF